jgi:hypothetical protein
MSLRRKWEDFSDDDGAYAIAVALLQVAAAIDRLGNADAATPMGAMEALGAVLSDKLERLADVISDKG